MLEGPTQKSTGELSRTGKGGKFMRAAPEWQVEVDCWTPGDWSKMLDLFNDANVYQTWSYGQVR